MSLILYDFSLFLLVVVQQTKDVMLYQEDDQLLWLLITKTDSDR